MKRIQSAIICFFLALSFWLVSPGYAGTVTWTNAASGNWSGVGNWNPNHVPGVGDTAVLPGLAASYTVTLDVAASVSGLTVGATSGASGQTLNTGSQTLTVNGLIQVNPLGAFNMNGGQLAGTNVLAGTLTLTAGTLTANMTVSNNSVLNIAGGGANVFFNAVTLTNNGTVNWTNTPFYTGVGTLIYNYGSWNAQGDNTFAGNYNGNPGTIFDNFGIFLKSGTPGTTTLDSAVTLNNTGTVNVQSGTLAVDGPGTNSGSGTFNSGSGGTNVFGGNYSFFGGTSFSGTGKVVVAGGTATVNGVMTSANLNLTGGTLTGTNVLAGTLTLSGGTLSGTMTVSNNSVLNIASGGANVFFYAATLTNNGTVNWTNTPFYTGGGTLIYNYGLWNAQSDNNFAGNYNGNPGTVFDNFGIFRKTGNTGTTTLDSVTTLNNYGTVNVQSGILSVTGLNSTGGTFSGNGVTEMVGGTATLKGLITSSNLDLTAGTLTGTNIIVGTLNLSGGTLTGNMTVSNNGVLNIAGGGGNVFFFAATLTNNGTVNWTNTAFYTGAGTLIYNYGLWNAQSDNGFAGNYNGNPGTVFDNFGTFRKTGNTGTTTLDGNVTLNNTGTLDVESGTLAADGGGTNTSSFINAATGATINFGGGYTFANSTTFTGGGNMVLSAGGVFYGTITASSLNLTGGTFSGTNVLVGTLTLSGGTLSGNMTVSNNSVLNIAAGGGNMFFFAATLTNYGTVNWTNTAFYTGGGSLIYNYGLWNAQSDNGFAGNYNGNPGTIFDNFGIFRKTGNTGTTTLDGNVTLNNTGAVEVASGTLLIENGAGTNSGSGSFNIPSGATINFGGGYTFANSTIFSGGGNVVLTAGGVFYGTITASNLNLTGGTLSGTNVLAGTLTLSGGTLSGNMTVSNNSVLNIAAGGGNVFFYAATLTNYGTVNWTNTAFYTGAGTLIYNYGLWNAQSDNGFAGNYNGNPGTIFDNFGIFRKSGNTGATTLDGNVTLNNTGTLDAQLGNISLQGPYNLTNGTLNFGLNAPTSYGAIVLAGAAPLTGTISANLNSNYVPLVGASFPVLTFTASSGAFTNAKLPALAVWQTTYNAADVTIKVLKWVPQLAWTPTSIVYGTVLGAAQLDATAASPTNLNVSLPGAFTYTPPAGTALFASNNQILSVSFVPSDLVNYTNTGATATINVTPAPLTVTANSFGKTYGLNVTFAGTEFTTAGLKYSDTVTAVTLASGGAAATAAVAGSPYPITNSAAVGAGLVNYTISYVNGALTVNRAPLTVTASAEGKTYGQTVGFGPGSLLFGSSGLQNGETIGTVTLGSLGGGPAEGVAGSPYTIIPSAATGGTFTAGNYAITYANGALTVNKAPLTVTASPESKAYGATLAFGSGSALFSSSVLSNSETIGSVTLAVSGNGGAATATVAGSPYTITPSAATGGTFAAGNYAITYATGNLTVTPVPLTITANNRAKTYGQLVTFSGTEFTGNGFLNGDTVTSVTLTSAGAAANAKPSGSPYPIVPGAAAGSAVGNYTITYVNGILTVTAPALNIQSSLTNVVLSWTTNAGTAVLNQTGSLSLTAKDSWTPVTTGITVVGTNNTFTTNDSSGIQFYKLIAP